MGSRTTAIAVGSQRHSVGSLPRPYRCWWPGLRLVFGESTRVNGVPRLSRLKAWSRALWQHDGSQGKSAQRLSATDRRVYEGSRMASLRRGARSSYSLTPVPSTLGGGPDSETGRRPGGATLWAQGGNTTLCCPCRMLSPLERPRRHGECAARRSAPAANGW